MGQSLSYDLKSSGFWESFQVEKQCDRCGFGRHKVTFTGATFRKVVQMRDAEIEDLYIGHRYQPPRHFRGARALIDAVNRNIKLIDDVHNVRGFERPPPAYPN